MKQKNRVLGKRIILTFISLQMTNWAASKFTPGKFLGSTGANILSVKQLQSGGSQAWARKVRMLRGLPVLFLENISGLRSGARERNKEKRDFHDVSLFRSDHQSTKLKNVSRKAVLIRGSSTEGTFEYRSHLNPREMNPFILSTVCGQINGIHVLELMVNFQKLLQLPLSLPPPLRIEV